MERLRGTAAPISAGPPAGETGSPTQEAVAAYGALAGDGCPHRRGPTNWGDGESCPGGGRCVWSACGGRLPPSARAHRLGGRGVLPKRQSLPMEGLRGSAAPIGAGPPAGGTEGTGSPTQELVAAYGAPARDCCPQRPGPTQLGGRGVLPKRQSLPMERLQGTAAPIGAGPPAWGHEATEAGLAYAPVSQAHGHNHIVQCFSCCTAAQTSSVPHQVVADCSLALVLWTLRSARTHHPPTVPVSL